MVKAFTERDILDSIELRGTLEGLAARFAAERGVSARSLEPLKECLADLDQLVRQDPISVEAFSAYVTMNARFHALLTELSGSAPVIRADRPRLGDAVRFAERIRDGAVGAAGGAPDPADRAGPSPHRGRRHREPRGRPRRSHHARALPARRAQSAAGAAQPRAISICCRRWRCSNRPPTRSPPCALPNNGAGAPWMTIRDVTPDDPRIPLAARPGQVAALPARQPHRRQPC